MTLKPKEVNKLAELQTDTGIWLNRSKSGKGFTIRVSDENMLTGSIQSLEKVLKEEMNGIQLSRIVNE